jgi:hypothetical protein
MLTKIIRPKYACMNGAAPPRDGQRAKRTVLVVNFSCRSIWTPNCDGLSFQSLQTSSGQSGRALSHQRSCSHGVIWLMNRGTLYMYIMWTSYAGGFPSLWGRGGNGTPFTCNMTFPIPSTRDTHAMTWYISYCCSRNGPGLVVQSYHLMIPAQPGHQGANDYSLIVSLLLLTGCTKQALVVLATL